MFPCLNIRHWFARLHPSMGENHSGNSCGEGGKCKQAYIDTCRTHVHMIGLDLATGNGYSAGYLDNI